MLICEVKKLINHNQVCRQMKKISEERLFLEKLMNSYSVSGFEEDASKVYEEYVKQFSTVFRDSLNNCYAVLNSSSSKRILIEAHIDEIGFQVTYIDDMGFVYVRQNGGIDCATLPGSIVEIHTSDNKVVPGVIGKRPIHVQKPDERVKVVELEELWIDTGLSKENVLEMISVGDVVSFRPNYFYIDENRIVSKGLDDKIGVFVIAEAIRRLSKENLYIGVCAVATVQEEVGCKGAKVCVGNIEPQMSISVDVGFATDVPNISKKKYGNIALGRGPVINCNTDCNREMVNIAKSVAKDVGIDVQLNANSISTGGTNTASLQVSNKGVKTLLLSIPNRYMHTQVEMCDLRDVESAIELIVETILFINTNKLL